MKEKLREILIFAGTTEGRTLSEYLAAAKIKHTICVATEYGEIVLKQHPLVTVHRGRMGQKEIEEFLGDGRFAIVVDATHPFAEDITRNIKAAVSEMEQAGTSIIYLRMKRDGDKERENGIFYFGTNEACAKALEDTKGPILLTTGIKELPKYCVSEKIRNRLFIRVLPSVESLSLCMGQGICGRQVIAMQGPFSVEMNEAIIGQYGISCLVTKESGASGGYPEKIEAAKKTGTQIFVVGRPEEEGGYSFFELCRRLEEIAGKRIFPEGKLEITLAGVGMGNAGCMTKEVEDAIGRADILLGAERILENLSAKAEKRCLYKANQVIPYLLDMAKRNHFMQGKKVVILFSGDSGFYSGCKSLYASLEEEIKKERLEASVRVLPGISSVAYLASCIGESYQDAAVYSMHGRTLCNLAHRIKNSPKTFLLTSGVKDINYLGEMLLGAGMPECEIITGYRLSYEEQRIEKYMPQECCNLREEGLYTCFIKNPYAQERKLAHGIADGEFARGKVPMTKEEVREVSICKLQLHEDAVVYDIGSGTGSVAVEIASLSDEIQVYAVEHKQEAVSLIERNKRKFGLQNITVVGKTAPQGLSDLPRATHAFIGGSGGRLKEILAALWQINPKMRIVVNAVSMETICEMKEIISADGRIEKEEVIQLQVSKASKVGNHHLLQSGNPVWIFAFNFSGGE